MEPWHCCRTCLCVENLNLIFPLPEHSEKYSDVISSVTGIQVRPNDSLSQLMCAQCINFTNEAYKFRKKCDITQKTLLDRLDQKSMFEIKIEPRILKSDVVASIDIADLLYDNDFRDYDDNITLSKYYIEIEKNAQEDIVQNEQPIDSVTENNPTSLLSGEKPATNNGNSPKGINLKEKSVKNKEGKLKEKPIVNKERTAKKRGRTKKENQEGNETEKRKESVKEEIQCELCNKMLTSKLSLRNHYKIHTGFDVICEHCGKKFITRRLLLMHCKAKHGYEKTDKCSYCDYRASNAEQVKIHERLHTGEKPYACSCCGARFHRKSSYLQHVAIHLPDKTVQCDQCPARFKSVTLMRIHRARHRPPQYTYKCRVCCNTFTRRRNVVRHLSRIHSLQAESEHIDRTKCA